MTFHSARSGFLFTFFWYDRLVTIFWFYLRYVPMVSTTSHDFTVWAPSVLPKLPQHDHQDHTESSHPDVFCKNCVLENFTKFTGKHLYESFFFNNIAGLRPATLLRKRLWHRCFPVNFVKFLRTPFFTEHLRWRLLST